MEHVGEEAAEAMLSQFPARDLDEPVTKEFVRGEIADVHIEFANVRAEIADLRGEMTTEFAKVRGEMDAGLAGLRGDMTTEFAKVRGEMATGFAVLRQEMGDIGKHVATRVQVTIGIATGFLAAVAYVTR